MKYTSKRRSLDFRLTSVAQKRLCLSSLMFACEPACSILLSVVKVVSKTKTPKMKTRRPKTYENKHPFCRKRNDFVGNEVISIQSNLYVTALYIAVTLCTTVTEQLLKNCLLYLLISWPAYSGHLYITYVVTPLTSWIPNFIVFYLYITVTKLRYDWRIRTSFILQPVK